MNKLLVSLLLILSFLIFAPPIQASIFYLSPDNLTVTKGSNFAVQVKLDSQDDVVNGISAYLAFPQDKLEVTDIQGNVEALPIKAEETVEGNVIKISRANLSSLSGDVRIATINFRTKEAGNAQIEFIPGSAAPKTIDSSDSLNLNTSRGSLIKINDSTDNPGPGDIDQPPQKPPHCEAKQESNNNQMTNITNLLTGSRVRLDTIYALVDDYYTTILIPSGKSSTGYLTQRLVVDAKRNQTIQLTSKLKVDIAGFSCALNNPKDALSQIKKEAQSSKSTLMDYKDALRTLIVILRKN